MATPQATHTLRFEGPPESGKTAKAQQFFRTLRYTVPMVPEDAGTEDVAILPIRELLREPPPGRPFSPKMAEESIEMAMHALNSSLNPRALLVTRTRDVFAVAGEHAAHVLDYLRRTAEGWGLEYLVFEDSQPSIRFDDAPARKQWDSLEWLVNAESVFMPPATSQNVGEILQSSLFNNRQFRVVARYTETYNACQLASYRLGVVFRLVDAAARIAIAENDAAGGAKQRIVSLGLPQYEAGAVALMSERQREHSMILRGPLARTEESLPLAMCVAKFSKDGVYVMGNEVRDFVATAIGRTPTSGALQHAAKMLIRDGVLWLSGTDAHAYLADALLATRLAYPNLAMRAEQAVATRSLEASTRSSMMHP